MNSENFYQNHKIFIAALSYNRANIFKKSMLTLVKALDYSNAIHNSHIAVFDDASNINEPFIIEDYCKILKTKFDIDITLFKGDVNLGYGKNYMRGVEWFISHNLKNDFLYMHETDLILEKKWFLKCSEIFKLNLNRIISPVHHINHLNFSKHAYGMFDLYNKSINKSVLKENRTDIKEMILNEGKTIFKNKYFKANISYGLIGARLASYNYWKKIFDNKEFIFLQNDKEDMALTFIGKNNCVYLVPGSAKISFKPGLHGYMFLNIASYDVGLDRFIFFVSVKRFIIKFFLKIFKKVGILKILKRILIKN